MHACVCAHVCMCACVYACECVGARAIIWGGVWTCKMEDTPPKTFGINYLQNPGGWASEKVGNITCGAEGGVQRMRTHALQSMHP